MNSDARSVKEVVVAAMEAVRLEFQKRGSRPWKASWPVRRVVLMVIYDRLLLIQAALHRPAGGASDGDEHRDRRIIETVEKLLDWPIDEDAAWDVANSLKELLPDCTVIELDRMPQTALASLGIEDAARQHLGEIGRTLPLTAEEEISLGKRMEAARLGKERLSSEKGLSSEEREQLAAAAYDGEVAQNLLIMSSVRLAVSMAKEHEGRGVSLAELIQEGKIGLARAASRFDYRLGYRFTTYASWWIRQAVTRRIAVQPHMSRLQADVSEQIPIDHTLQQVPWDQLYDLLATFSPRDAKVLQARFGLIDGRSHTSEELGKRFGVTPERVHQLEKQALERLYRSGDTGERQDSLV